MSIPRSPLEAMISDNDEIIMKLLPFFLCVLNNTFSVGKKE